MRTVETLIDECIEKCKGQAKLARLMEISPQALSAMKLGTMPVSPATVGLLCDVMELEGEEARRLAVLAIVANAKPEKRGVLRRAFFVCWAAGATCGAAVMLNLSLSNDVGAMTEGETRGTEPVAVYTLSSMKALLRRWFHSLPVYLAQHFA